MHGEAFHRVGLGSGRGRCCRIYDGIAPLYIAWNLVWEVPIRGVVAWGACAACGCLWQNKVQRQWQDTMSDTPHSHSPPTSNLRTQQPRREIPVSELGPRRARARAWREKKGKGGIGLTRVPVGPASVPDARPELLVRPQRIGHGGLIIAPAAVSALPVVGVDAVAAVVVKEGVRPVAGLEHAVEMHVEVTRNDCMQEDRPATEVKTRPS